FPTSRHADLWSGIGLACAYAGGVERSALGGLREAAGEYMVHLGQGVAFAAKARQRAGNPATHTALACEVICRTSADEAADITDIALGNLAASIAGGIPAYEEWRRWTRAQVDREVLTA